MVRHTVEIQLMILDTFVQICEKSESLGNVYLFGLI